MSKRVPQAQEAETLQKLMERLKHAQTLPEAKKIFDELLTPKPKPN